ncbi:Protein lifeguard 1 [Chionoecetes opilio]|uniref:Protein lifeguard 1 n=1 Tax=Chionoecetes opilio TaxID=41210 RepID=A0A8J4Y3R8_CHIOP|nr:Protein lifeguard 1 [Chionoecetes opilio]
MSNDLQLNDPYPMEQQDVAEFEFSDKSVRRGFIRKVYAVLTCQLVVTFGIVAVFVLVPEVKSFAYYNPALFWSAFGITFAMVILLGCCGNFRRKTPYNYIALLVFTLCEGYLLGCVGATYDPRTVLIAVGATIVVTVALTLFAFQTKWDFTLMGGMLYTFLIMLLVFGIMAGIFRSDILNILYACLGALLFSFYIVFDTQIMLGGDHKLAISPEEYIFAALNLYLDVVNLFIYLLAIFGGSRN